MEHVGIDVHKNQSQISILTGEGELIEKRICTERKRFEAVLGSHPQARILIEASTESEWVARCLEEPGTRWSWLTPTTRRCTVSGSCG